MKISTSIIFFYQKVFSEDIAVFRKWGSPAQKFAHLDISVIVKDERKRFFSVDVFPKENSNLMIWLKLLESTYSNDHQESDYLLTGGTSVWTKLVQGRSLPLASESLNSLKRNFHVFLKDWRTLFASTAEHQVSQSTLLAKLPGLGREWRVALQKIYQPNYF